MLTKGDVARYLARPDPRHAAILIFGADSSRVVNARTDAEHALVGPQGVADMRLTRLAAADVRRDPAALGDALRAVGFFPGPRAVTVENATDGMADLMAATLKDWRDGDARLIVTAGALTGKSALKTVFDRSPAAEVIGFYDDPPTQAEIAADLRAAGIAAPEADALAELEGVARGLDAGAWRQTLQTLTIFKHGDPTPLSAADVVSVAPVTVEAAADDLILAVADRDRTAIGPLMRRLQGQRVPPATIAIRALQHFRLLHGLSVDSSAVFLRGSVAVKRRTEAQARSWSRPALEEAIALILDADLTLRSGGRAPMHALVERTLIRIASMTR
jgi:DNA polymerase-3 subunit delta